MSTVAGHLRVVTPEERAAPTIVEAYQRCAETLYRWFAVRTGRDRHLADDLMQQLWVKAVEADGVSRAAWRVEIPPDNWSETTAEYWLRRVARNLLATHWRTVARRPGDAPVADAAVAAALAERIANGELPEELLSKRETRDQLLLAITELPHYEQQLIVGHYFEGRSHADLAAIERQTTRAIEGALYRARGILREKLRRLQD
ncbi:MAG: RNA polymerase sigma factor [Phycisphaerae bacterium]